MAETSPQSQQNKAFLQQMERQRLNKPCNRTIDLRGKVKSECQAYKIGDRTHYLDDRAYLILKQLMVRFNGRYTIGVYEMVLKAIKQMEQSESSSTTTEDDSNQLPFIDIDYDIQRREQRVLVTRPIRVRLGDVLYHGYTMDIAVSALRVSMKRTHTLEVGSEVSVELIEEFEQEGHSFLSNLPYVIRKIEHDEKNTTAILGRVEQQNEAVLPWLQNWVQSLSGHRSIDIDSHIQNQIADCYIQLWLKRMTPWLLWLKPAEHSHTIAKCDFSRLATQEFSQLSQLNPAILESLPLDLLADEHPLLMVVSKEKCWAGSLNNAEQAKQLLLLHQQVHDSEVLILIPMDVSASVEDDNSLIRNIQAVQAQSASKVQVKINQIKKRLSLYNITSACDFIQPAITSKQDSSQYEVSLKNSLSGVPFPSPLSTHIERSNQRYYIQTPVTAYIGDDRLKLKTEDVSVDGLAIRVPSYVEVKINQQIHLDFTRWQELSPNTPLKQLPYLVRNKLLWNGEYHLGLQRVKHNRLFRIEGFFNEAIATNKDKLRENKQDIIDRNESLLYLDLFKPTIRSIPVFLGIDDAGQRGIQMIANTRTNHAKQLPSAFWEALNTHSSAISEQIRALPNDSHAIATTLYCSQSAQGHWAITFEEEIQTARQKSMVIQRLLSAEDARVFHCQMVSIPAINQTLEKALADSFLQWRSKRAAKVKQIRQQLHQLYGLIELTDITQLFTQVYSD